MGECAVEKAVEKATEEAGEGEAKAAAETAMERKAAAEREAVVEVATAVEAATATATAKVTPAPTAATAAPSSVKTTTVTPMSSGMVASLHVSFLHIDCDLYSSTKTVLTLLAPAIHIGTVIVFDEYCGYTGWEQHEARAWAEFCSEFAVRFEWIEPPPKCSAKAGGAKVRGAKAGGAKAGGARAGEGVVAASAVPSAAVSSAKLAEGRSSTSISAAANDSSAEGPSKALIITKIGHTSVPKEGAGTAAEAEVLESVGAVAEEAVIVEAADAVAKVEVAVAAAAMEDRLREEANSILAEPLPATLLDLDSLGSAVPSHATPHATPHAIPHLIHGSEKQMRPFVCAVHIEVRGLSLAQAVEQGGAVVAEVRAASFEPRRD